MATTWADKCDDDGKWDDDDYWQDVLDAEKTLRDICGSWRDLSESVYTLTINKLGAIDVSTKRPTGKVQKTNNLIRIEHERDAEDVQWGRVVWGRDSARAQYFLYQKSRQTIVWQRPGRKPFHWERISGKARGQRDRDNDDRKENLSTTYKKEQTKAPTNAYNDQNLLGLKQVTKQLQPKQDLGRQLWSAQEFEAQEIPFAFRRLFQPGHHDVFPKDSYRPVLADSAPYVFHSTVATAPAQQQPCDAGQMGGQLEKEGWLETEAAEQMLEALCGDWQDQKDSRYTLTLDDDSGAMTVGTLRSSGQWKETHGLVRMQHHPDYAGFARMIFGREKSCYTISEFGADHLTWHRRGAQSFTWQRV